VQPGTTFIENHLIFACEHDDCPQPVVIDGSKLERLGSESYPADEWACDFQAQADYLLGVDIGRTKDLTVMWLLEKLGDAYWTRFVLVLTRMQLRKQYKHLERFMPHIRRTCIDQSGIGRQLGEDALEAFGSYRVEPITFTNQAKEAIATTLKPEFEDARLRLPKSQQIRQEIRKVKKVQLPSGAVRYAGERDKNGHADFFWALALARYADSGGYVPYQASRGRASRRL
jgi:phage FluMu gp28-like protein